MRDRLYDYLLKRLGITLSILLFSLISAPTLAAQKIEVSYGIIQSSIALEKLEQFAKTGITEGDISFFANNLNPEQLINLRRLLLTPINLNSVEISQFFYTPIGENILKQVAQIIQTESGRSDFYAIRSALILAAAEQPHGFTILDILQKYPINGVSIDLERSLELSDRLRTLKEQTQQAIALISKQSATAASQQQQINFFNLPDLRLPGNFSWTVQTLKLNDRQRDYPEGILKDSLRNREFIADIYLPQPEQAKKTTFPVVVISHGLGSDRNSFRYLAQQLASYGFAVAVPEHPNSNSEQLRSLLTGRINVVTEPKEFIDRPLDVKYLLDVLEKRYGSNLNLQQVGVIGQSFGGYTALALAGASLNFEQLQKDCGEVDAFLNVSLLLQCRAIKLPQMQYNLRDPRIKAAIAINPISNTIFGRDGLEQISIPVMIVSSSGDRVAPALPEQIQPFSWLTTEQKYLVLLEGGTHFSAIAKSDSSPDPIQIPSEIIGSDTETEIARRYLKALSVAFLTTYIKDSPKFRSYLSADYAKTINRAILPLQFVQSLPTDRQTQIFQ
ncbi:MAG TPA: alpha/beta hydrolase [Coleofasciculaceae cyanobacterium]|jgi:predicted dienelactone hydrolase